MRSAVYDAAGDMCEAVLGGRGGQGRAVQVDPMKPVLKAPGTKRLKLECDEPLSNLAFDFNLRRYIKVNRGLAPVPGQGEVFVHNVGRCNLKPELKAPD